MLMLHKHKQCELLGIEGLGSPGEAQNAFVAISCLHICVDAQGQLLDLDRQPRLSFKLPL